MNKACIIESIMDTIDGLEQQLGALAFIQSGLHAATSEDDKYLIRGCVASIENVIDAITIIQQGLNNARKNKNG